jgi:hypothetical protein
MKRRTFITYVSASVVALTVAACGAQSTNPPAALAKDKPTLMYFWTPN